MRSMKLAVTLAAVGVACGSGGSSRITVAGTVYPPDTGATVAIGSRTATPDPITGEFSIADVTTP